MQNNQPYYYKTAFSKGCTERYKFGFNGKEKDNEFYGEGNMYDLGLREYDARLGRPITIDPRSGEYPWQTPYAYHRNNPVNWIDFMGGGGDPEEGELGQFDSETGVYTLPTVSVASAVYIVGTIHYAAPSIWNVIGNFFRNADNAVKGEAYWTFGIQYGTKDGKWNGNTANPVKPENFDLVIELNWDDIQFFTGLANGLNKDIFYKSKTFQEQAQKLVFEKQKQEKNGDAAKINQESEKVYKERVQFEKFMKDQYYDSIWTRKKDTIVFWGPNKGRINNETRTKWKKYQQESKN